MTPKFDKFLFMLDVSRVVEALGIPTSSPLRWQLSQDELFCPLYWEQDSSAGSP